MFFDGTLADSTSKIRLVGFNSVQQKKLQQMHTKKIPVQLINIKVKTSRYGDGYEAMLKNSSEIRESPRTDIDVTAILAENPGSTGAREIVLAEISELELYTKVTVAAVKAVEVKEIEQLKEKVKQDIVVGDRSGTAKLTLWEDNVGEIQQGRSYALKDFVVRQYQTIKYLSKGEGSQLVMVGDIGPVLSSEVPKRVDDEVVLKQVVVIGVPALERYRICFKCRSRVEPLQTPLGCCCKFDCSMIQRYDLCQEYSTAKLLLMHETDGGDGHQSKIVQVTVRGDAMLREIVGASTSDEVEITQDLLLCGKPLASVTITKETKTVRGISHC